MVKVGIIGGGIMGISCGLMVQQQIPGAQVTIYAESLPPNTTGDIAAGLWEPYAINDDARITKWGKLTYDYLYELLRSPEQYEAGVGLRPCYQLVTKEAEHRLPFWSDAAYGMRLLAKEEFRMYPKAVGGYTFTAPICEGKRHNAWLMAKYKANGGTVINRKINSFSELVNEHHDYIINCPGLGAKTLCNDDQMYPVRGQVRRVRAPWVNYIVMMASEKGHTYIIPNADTVVLGGTQYKDDWGTDVRERDLQHILETTSELIPSLKNAEVVTDGVGLRPGRTSVRLELEKMQVDGKELKVIHNYGHGGSGYTLFYGCSLEVLEILKKDLASA